MKTKSEGLFEGFLPPTICRSKRLRWTPRPGRIIASLSAGSEIIFELKELAEDGNFGVVKDPAYPHIKSSSRTLGDHVRRRIESSKEADPIRGQARASSILLIYNNVDPVFQDFGTEPMDFTAAMYGAYTILINRENGTASDWFNGKDRCFK